MEILVLSDIHDHIDNLRKVLSATKVKTEAIIFCGDMVSPFTTGLLSEANLPTYACLGNNDEDHIGMVKKGKNFTWTHLSQEFGEIELDKRRIAFCHYPKLAEFLAQSGEYDAVFYGYTHIARNEKFENTLIVNPDAVCGINFDKGTYDNTSYAIYDTVTNTAEIITL